MNGDTVAHGELDVAAVEHRHRVLFEPHAWVRLGRSLPRHALAEDRRPVRPADNQFGLEQVVLVLGPALLLAVDEEQGDDDAVISFADLALDVNAGELVGEECRRAQGGLVDVRRVREARCTLVSRFQTRLGWPVRSSIWLGFVSRLYWPQRAWTFSALADLSTQKVRPKDDGK